MSTDGFQTVRPGAELDRAQQITLNFAQHSSVSGLLGANPDNPATVRAIVSATPGGPCFHLIAETLRELAEQFEDRHRGGGCV
jgi:hypothetical protein